MKCLKIIFLLASIYITSACSSLPVDIEKADSYAFTDTAQTSLGILAAQITGSDTSNSYMSLIGEGTDAFLTRILLDDINLDSKTKTMLFAMDQHQNG